MSVSVRPLGNIRIIQLTGELTLGGPTLDEPLRLTGPQLAELRNTLRVLLDEGCRKIVIDIGQVTSLDSAGLGELVSCRKRALEKGGDILLMRPQGKVREFLDVLHLTSFFKIIDDEQAALASFPP